MKAAKVYEVFRSAITGRFVSRLFAQLRPSTTVRHERPRKKPK